MKRAFVTALVACAASGIPQVRFRSSVDAVSIDVSVRDGNRPVTGLATADFKLTDNGVPQIIQDLSVERQPIDVSLLVDSSASVVAQRDVVSRIQTGIAEVSSLIQPPDRLRLIHFSSRISEVGGMNRIEEGGLLGDGGTALLDTVAASLMRPVDAGWRHLIIALTDGIDTSSALTQTVIRNVVNRSDAILYVLAISPTVRAWAFVFSLPEGSPDDDSVFDRRLTDLVDTTGGRFFHLRPTDQLHDILAVALADFKSRYVLRYLPAGVEQPGWHAVVVSVPGRKAYDIRARKGYQR